MTNLKEKLEEIRKLAKGRWDPLPKKESPATPATPATPPVESPKGRWKPLPGGAKPAQIPTGKAVGSSNIKEMQKAIQNFATIVTKYDTKPERDAKGKIVQKISKDDNRRNFNDFLAEQFSASAEIHGDEYSSDPQAISRESKLPTDLIQLSNILDSLRRIGSSYSETLPDGVWDWKTNNAVRNVYAIATALVAANEALGGTAPNDPRVFRRGDLVKLQNAIPKSKDPVKDGVSQADLSAKAAQLTPLIEKLTEFYRYYSTDIMGHPYYKRYIEDDAVLLTVQPGTDPAALDSNQIERMKNSQQIVLPYLRVQDKDNRPINVDNRVLLSYLQNRVGLQKLMVDLLGYKPNEVNNSAAMRRTVKRIIDRINKVIDTYKPVQAPPKPSMNQLKANPEVAQQVEFRNIV